MSRLKTGSSTFGAWLAKIREEKGAGTQEEAAMRIGISRSQLARWETGFSYPSRENVEAIAVAYSLPVEDILSQMGIKLTGSAGISSWAYSVAVRLDRRAAALPVARRDSLEKAIDAMISAASGV